MPPATPIASPLVILSPHRDDAAFSASRLLLAAAAAELDTTILNLFTRSTYAPLSHIQHTPERISALRLAEDQAVLQALGPSVHLRDLQLLDAPLRLGISDTTVLNNPLAPAARLAHTREIAARLPALATASLLALPLSVGNHVDHRIGRDAGLHLLPATHLTFYQDLPYACRISAEDLARETAGLLAELTTLTGLAFHPHLLRSPGAGEDKHRLAACYPSQITPDVVDQMTGWTGALGGEVLFFSPASAATLRRLLPSADLTTLSPAQA